MPRCRSETHRIRRLGRDERAVSEVLGFLITFGIIAGILLISMIGFNNAQRDSQARVATIQATSIAQRVAGVAVDVALFAESHNLTNVSVFVDLPPTLQRTGYTVNFTNASVTVFSSLLTGNVSQSIFGAVRNLGNTTATLAGGPLYVTYCGTSPATKTLTIRATPC